MSDEKTQLELYGGRPPFVRGSATSEAASDSIAAARGKIQSQVLAHVAALGDFGATCDEVEDALALRHQTASARIRELYQINLLLKTDRTRPTRSGRKAAVYVARKK